MDHPFFVFLLWVCGVKVFCTPPPRHFLWRETFHATTVYLQWSYSNLSLFTSFLILYCFLYSSLVLIFNVNEQVIHLRKELAIVFSHTVLEKFLTVICLFECIYFFVLFFWYVHSPYTSMNRNWLIVFIMTFFLKHLPHAFFRITKYHILSGLVG